MIDIHSHIVWGVDDGSASMDQSLAMLRLAAEKGTTDIVATPHYNRHWTPEAALIRERIEQLTAARGGIPRIHRGWELNVHVLNIEAALASPVEFTINERGYILLELPHMGVPANMDRILNSFRERGMRPVIAHPERNPALMQIVPELASWVADGCLLQLTGQSITGDAGAEAREAAWELLHSGLAAIVASDSHDDHYRPPDLLPAWRAVEAKLGSQAAEHLFVTAPRCVIEGADVPPAPQTPDQPRKKWPRLWR